MSYCNYSKKKRGGGDALNRLRQGFTLGELTIVLIVITIVVIVTLPITLSKMKKVDYDSYYMGYSLIKDMSANILQEVLSTPLDEPESQCLVESFGECIQEPAFIPTPVSKSECEELAEVYDIIGGCYYEQDYYAGAVKACNGSLAKMMVTGKVFSMVEKGTDIETLEKLNLLNASKYVALCMSGSGEYYDCPMDYTAFWISLVNSVDSKRGPIYTDSTASGGDASSQRNNATAYALCMVSTDDSEPEDEEIMDTYNEVLCNKIKTDYNISSSDCSVTPDNVKNKVASDTLNTLTPNIVFVNGLKLYIGTDYEELPELSDAEEEKDRKGFKIYVDINGSSGKGKLWEDVYPFYLLGSGKVLLAYNEEEPSGGNTKENLSVNVIYDSYSGEKREVKLLMTDANFRSAACAIGYIKSEKYCGDKVQYDLCKDMAKDCRMMVKEPLKIF